MDGVPQGRMTRSLRDGGWLLLAVVAAASLGCARLIAWPSEEPDQEFVRRHIASMETKPFDGVVLQATLPGLEGAARSFTWSASTRRYSRQEFQPVVDSLRATPFRRFRHNFLRINLNPADRSFDMFEDDLWDIVIANFATASDVARDTGLRGLLVDPEAYAMPEPGAKDPRFNVFDFRLRRMARDFPAYREQAFRRGQAVGRVVTAAYPGIALLLAFGPSATCLRDDAPAEKPYGLLGAFVDGLLAGAGGRATVVEGLEFAYPYRSCTRFRDAYARLRGPCRDRSLNPAKYNQWLEIGFGVWLDFDSGNTCQDVDVAGRPCRWFDPSLYPPERRHLVDPERFARAIASARTVSDGYVWIYTTEPKWWTEANPLGENLPDAYVAALRHGQDIGALLCPRPGISPPGNAGPGSGR
jgi:hypothetical protein